MHMHMYTLVHWQLNENEYHYKNGLYCIKRGYRVGQLNENESTTSIKVQTNQNYKNNYFSFPPFQFSNSLLSLLHLSKII